MRVELDIRKPLVRGVPYKIGKQEPFIARFKYERLQLFCYRCGCLGHVDRDYDQERLRIRWPNIDVEAHDG